MRSKSFSLICLFSFFVTSLWAHDFTREELEALIEQLGHAEKIITDNDSKKFLKKVFDEPAILDNDKSLEQAIILLNRAYLIRDLELFLLQGGLKNEIDKNNVRAWLNEQTTLDDPQVRNEAMLLIERVRELFKKRISLQMNLKMLINKVKNAEQKKQMLIWLANPALLNDEDEQKKAEKLIVQVLQELGDLPSHGMSKRDKFIKDLCLFAYTGYRKFRYIKRIEKGDQVGKIGYLDYLAAGAYLVGSVDISF